MEVGSTQLTKELLQRALRDGRSWLTQLAEEGQLSGELRLLRRLTWHVLLGVVSGDTPEQWADELDRHRDRYNGYVQDLKRETDVKAVDPKFSNPLSRHVSNPFLKLEANDKLLAEIWKDVERTFPENQLLSSPESRNAMQRILFHWCRAHNPADKAAESYRQGMNELIGVVWFITRQGEYLEETSLEHQKLGVRLCGRQHNEADAFALFERIMTAGLQPMYYASGSSLAASRPTKSVIGELPRSRTAAHPHDQAPGPSSPILARCNFISDAALKFFDHKLYAHLQKLEIEPQVYLLRWLRLLFCREFCLEQTLLLWDALFADALQPVPVAAIQYPPARGGAAFVAVMGEASAASAALPLVDYVAVALLCSFRNDLLTSDQTDCLRRLMSGPAVPEGGGAQEIVDVAKKLRSEGKPLIAEPQCFTMVDSDDPDAEEEMTPTTSITSMEDDVLTHQAPRDNDKAPMEIPPQAQQLLSAAAQQAQGLLDAGRQALALAQKVPLLKPPLGADRGAASASRFVATSTDVRRSDREYTNISGGAFDGSEVSSTSGGIDTATELAELRRRVAAAELERDTIKKKANEFYLLKKAEWAEQIKTAQSQVATRDAQIAKLEQQLVAGKDEAHRQQQLISALEQQLSMAQVAAKEQEREKVLNMECAAVTSGKEDLPVDSAEAAEEF